MKWKVQAQENSLFAICWLDGGTEIANSLDKFTAECLCEAHNSAIELILSD